MSETVLAPRPAFRFHLGVLAPAPDHCPQPDLAVRTEMRPLWRKATADGALAPHHRWRAGARLRVGLLAWAQPAAANLASDGATVELLTCDVTRARLTEAAAKAARCAGLRDADAVMKALDLVAAQNAAVEGFREGLLDSSKSLVRRMAAYRGADHISQNRVRCCGLLMAPILNDLGARLEMADAASASVLDVLSDPRACIEVVRACCDGVARRYVGLSDMLARCNAMTAFSLSEADHAFLVAFSMRQTQPA